MTEPSPDDILDQVLRRAGEISEPPEGTFDRIHDSYLSMAQRPTRPVVTWIRRHPAVPIAAAAASLAMAVAGGALLAQQGDRDPLTTASSPASTITQATDAPANPTPTKSQAGAGTAGGVSGSQSFVFGSPTFDAFTQKSMIADVVEGQVVRSESIFIASGDDGAIFTRVTVQVKSARHSEPGSMIEVYEPGGQVLKKEMAKYFESKFGTLSAEELNEPVVEWQPMYPKLDNGQSVLLAIGPTTGRPSNQVWAVLTEAEDGTYQWPAGAAPNPGWPTSIGTPEVERLVQ